MTADELIAKMREFALEPRPGDDELDAMSAEEAWDKGCYAAWVTRKHMREMEPMRIALEAARAEVANLILAKLTDLQGQAPSTPEPTDASDE